MNKKAIFLVWIISLLWPGIAVLVLHLSKLPAQLVWVVLLLLSSVGAFRLSRKAVGIKKVIFRFLGIVFAIGVILLALALASI
jgi:hypothetical protein